MPLRFEPKFLCLLTGLPAPWLNTMLYMLAYNSFSAEARV